MMDAQTYLNRVLEPISHCVTPEIANQLMTLANDAELQERIDILADRNNNGELSEEERMELESYVHAGNFISILLAKARKHERQRAA